MSRKVHIDLGAYLGESIVRFFQQRRNVPIFDIYAFEPHPNNYIKLVENIGSWKGVNCINAAAGTKDGTIKLYISDSKECQRASEFENKIAGEVGSVSSVEVKTIDFCKWLKETTDSTDYISIAMNIEGAEYALMDAIIDNGLLDRIDCIEIKLHEQKVSDPKIKDGLVKTRERFLNEVKKYNFWVQIATKYRTEGGNEYVSDIVLDMRAYEPSRKG